MKCLPLSPSVYEVPLCTTIKQDSGSSFPSKYGQIWINAVQANELKTQISVPAVMLIGCSVHPFCKDTISILLIIHSFAYRAITGTIVFQSLQIQLLTSSSCSSSVTVPFLLSDTKDHKTSYSPCESLTSPGGSKGRSHPVLEAAVSCLCACGGISWRWEVQTAQE